MLHSPNAGLTPDVKFLRTAGIILAALALSAGSVSLFGLITQNEPVIEIAEAPVLEQGAEAVFQAVDANVAERHGFGLE